MKGLIHLGLPVLGLALALSSGCTYMKNLADPCYPERYWASSRDLVNEAFAPQVQNGHILDQTVWNECFEPGCETLNSLGLQKLSYLARRRPHPDPVIFLQTAQDLPYDQLNPQQLVIARTELDGKRKAAIEQFLGAQTVGRPANFQVVIHDPGELGLPGPAGTVIVQQWYGRFRGGLDTGMGVGGSSSGGTPTGGSSVGGP